MKKTSFFLAAFFASATGAFAQTLPQANIVKAVYAPVTFHDMTPEEGRVLNPLFSNYVSANAGMKMSTALIDLEGRGVASMAVRFVSPSTCSGTNCYSSVLRFRNNKWEISMNRILDKMEVETAASRKARNADAESMLIRVNGREVWQPFPDGSYHATSWGTARPLADMKSADLKAAALAGKSNITVPGKPEDWYSDFINGMLVLRAKLCSEAEGCKVVVMVAGQPATPWRIVLETTASGGRVAVVDETRDYMKDILVDTALGYDTWRWNSTTLKYAKAESSYTIAGSGTR